MTAGGSLGAATVRRVPDINTGHREGPPGTVQDREGPGGGGEGMACSGSQESLVERVPGRPSWGRALTTPGADALCSQTVVAGL